MVAAIATEVVLTEDSTAAPDTPASSDVSAPSAGNGARKLTDRSASGRMSRVKELPRKEEGPKDEKEGARSAPVAPPSRQATVLVARPVTEVTSARVKSLSGTERRGISGPVRTTQGRSAPAPAGPPSRLAGRSPGRSPKRSPPRSNSPSTGGAHRSPGRKEQELLEQKAVLEVQISDATRSQLLLQRMLDEERSRGAADRAKLAALGARIEQLERTRQSGPRLLEENQTLYTELEAQSQQIEILRQQVELLRDGGSQVLQDDDSTLREENLRLRRDLELSRAMLSRYTEELASIMPGMQKVLQKFNHDVKPRIDDEQEDERFQDPASSTISRPAVQDEVPIVQPSRLPVAPVAQEAPASFLAARKHEALVRKASTSPVRNKTEDAVNHRASSTGKVPATLGRGTPTLVSQGRSLCNRLVDEAARRNAKGTALADSARRVRRRSTSPQGASNREDKPRWQF